MATINKIDSYNRYPDEKGTERLRMGTVMEIDRVTTVSPMKRGLKVSTVWMIIGDGSSYNRFPDEKGTESVSRPTYLVYVSRYNRYPDEKGTERSTAS